MSEQNTCKKEENEIKDDKPWLLQTDGINILDIFNSEYVDYINTFSNDIIEMYENLGIEAARNILIEEITSVMSDASYINDRHIDLLCDIMTNKGYLTSINRQGINRGDVGPLAKSSFEDTTDQLIKAGIFSEKDNLSGVSSNIMMGQTIKSGTGLCNILLDEEYMINELKSMYKFGEDEIEENENDINVLLNIENEDDECSEGNFKFSSGID